MESSELEFRNCPLITITRNLACQVPAVFRRALNISPKPAWPIETASRTMAHGHREPGATRWV